MLSTLSHHYYCPQTQRTLQLNLDLDIEPRVLGPHGSTTYSAGALGVGMFASVLASMVHDIVMLTNMCSLDQQFPRWRLGRISEFAQRRP